MPTVTTIPGRRIEPHGVFPHPLILGRESDGTPQLRLFRVGTGTVRIDVNDSTVYEHPGAGGAPAVPTSRRVSPFGGFPFTLTLARESDGTHSVFADTALGGPHDLDGLPYLAVRVDDSQVWANRVPPLALEHGRVRIPTAVWLGARVGDIRWDTTRRIEEALQGEDLFDYRHAAGHVARWATEFGPVDTVIAREGYCLLDPLLHVVRYSEPGRGPVAVAVYDNGIDAPAGIRAHRDLGTPQTWRQLADADLACRRGHRWQLRGDTVTGPDAVRLPATQLLTAFAHPGHEENTARCPICGEDSRALLPCAP